VGSERTSVGLDVHARSVAAAAIDGVTGELIKAKLTPSHEHIRSWLGERAGPVAVAYEAGPTGFGLYRSLTAVGIDCVVVAPSKLQRPAGDRVKTDARDAAHLARLLRLGEVTAVAVPSVAQEAARDLVRAREDCRVDLMRARHRLAKLLLRQGIIYSGGQAWTRAHDEWLRRQRFDNPVTAMAFESDYDAVLAVTARRARLDKAITELAGDSEFTPLVRRLSCLRGVSTLTAFALAVEIGDWHRFTGASIGSFIGLVPSEHSSGASRKARLDHQDRQRARAAPAHRSRLAPPRPLRPRQGPASPLATRPTRRPNPRRRRQPAPARTLDHLQPATQERRHRQRRHRPRTRRLVLVTRRAGLIACPDDPSSRFVHAVVAAARGATRVAAMSSRPRYVGDARL
jgi:transposase